MPSESLLETETGDYEYHQPWFLTEYCAVRGEHMFTTSHQVYEHHYCNGSLRFVQLASTAIIRLCQMTIILGLVVMVYAKFKGRREGVFSPGSLLMVGMLVFLAHLARQLEGVGSLMIPLPKRGGFDDLPSLVGFSVSMTLVAGALSLRMLEKEVERRAGEVKERDQNRDGEDDWEHEAMYARILLMSFGVGTAIMIFWMFGLVIWPVVHFITGLQILRIALATGKMDSGRRDVEKSEKWQPQMGMGSMLSGLGKYGGQAIILHAIATFVFMFANIPMVWDGQAPLETTNSFLLWEIIFDGLGTAVILALVNEEYQRPSTQTP